MARRVLADEGIQSREHSISGSYKGLASDHGQTKRPFAGTSDAEDGGGAVEVSLHDFERDLRIDEIEKEVGRDQGNVSFDSFSTPNEKQDWTGVGDLRKKLPASNQCSKGSS